MPELAEKTESRTENRATRTRNALLAAGFELMAERPVDAIPIDDLVSLAGVAKGSFFNHFGDKNGFAKAVALEVRAEIEKRINKANHGIANPITRLAGGMREAAEYALIARARSMAILRISVGFTARNHPLNDGVRGDIDDCIANNFLRPEAKQTGVLFWLGLCHTMMANVIEKEFSRQETAEPLREMLVLGLIGLGVDESTALNTAQQASNQLANND